MRIFLNSCALLSVLCYVIFLFNIVLAPALGKADDKTGLDTQDTY